MERNDLAMIKAENDRLVNDIEKLKQRLREEISRTQAGVRLDLNLEKGRLREESSGQELKIKEVDTRIEQEIAGLRINIQASKVRTRIVFVGHVLTVRVTGNNPAIPCWLWHVYSVQYFPLSANLITTVTGCSALLMAYLRFRS
jgi:hypothetical protein